MEPGALIVPGPGHVLVTGPFAMVMSGTAGDAQAADDAFRRVAERRAWTFDTVAAALQDLVLDRNPRGVAAILTAGGDPVVFVFDEAMAIFDGSAHSGTGRDEWVTEIVMGDHVELRLAGNTTMPPQHGTSLRDGLVPGAGLGVELALVPTSTGGPPPPVYTPAPPPAYGAGWGAGPLAQYARQPPPPTAGRVPPPPHASSARRGPGRVHHAPPPPPPE